MRERNPTPPCDGRPEILQPGGIFHGPSLGRARARAHENEKTVLAMRPSCQSRLLAGSSEVPHPLPVFSIGRGSLRARGFGIGPPSKFKFEMEKEPSHA